MKEILNAILASTNGGRKAVLSNQLMTKLGIEPLKEDFKDYIYAATENGVEITSDNIDHIGTIKKIDGRWSITKQFFNRMRFNHWEDLGIVKDGDLYIIGKMVRGEQLLITTDLHNVYFENEIFDQMGYEYEIPIVPGRRESYIQTKEATLRFKENNFSILDKDYSKELHGFINGTWISAYGFDEDKIKRNFNGFYNNLETVCPVKMHWNFLIKLVSHLIGEKVTSRFALEFAHANYKNHFDQFGDYFLFYINKEDVFLNATKNTLLEEVENFQFINKKVFIGKGVHPIGRLYLENLGYSKNLEYLPVIKYFDTVYLEPAKNFKVFHGQKNFKNADIYFDDYNILEWSK